MELNPQVVFERMFGDGSTAEERAARRKRDSSILDSLTGSLSRMRTKVSESDRQRLDDYTTNVREIERRLQIAMKASAVAPENFMPVGVPQTFDEHIKIQFDLLALAFQADITRVGTLLFARDLTGLTYPECAAPTSGFHGVSHHGENPRQIDLLSKINQYHVKMLAHLIDNLSKRKEGDGTLLDRSLVLYGSNMGNSNQHVHYDVPHVLVGGANGKMKGGRHLAYPTKTIPTGNLLLSVLDKFDIHQDSIGDSTGRLEAL
jgi:L-lactate utilization protein LutC